MNDDGVDSAIRQAIGGDTDALAAMLACAGAEADAVTLTMGALLQSDPAGLERALARAKTSRERQVVAIARAHLAGDHDLVDALARDHLASFPGSLIVSWIASK
jgi:hypothetical protein